MKKLFQLQFLCFLVMLLFSSNALQAQCPAVGSTFWFASPADGPFDTAQPLGSYDNPLTDWNSGTPSVLEAITDCPGPIVVNLRSCYYNTDGSDGDVNWVQENLQDNVTINGNGATLENQSAGSKWLIIAEHDNWVVNDVTLTGYNGTDGGAIAIYASTNVTLNNVDFIENPTTTPLHIDVGDNFVYGYGNTSVVLNDCLFSGNPPVSETVSTGGMEIEHTGSGASGVTLDVVINNTDFYCNARQGYGGALAIINDNDEVLNVDINGGTFGGNHGDANAGDGGAIYVEGENTTFDIDGTVFSCNDTEGSVGNAGGGAIRIYDGPTSTITNATFYNNDASGLGGYGGAINFGTSGPTGSLTISNTVFINNISERGGAIYLEGGTTTTCTDCLFSGNGLAGGSGGAVFVDGGGTYSDLNTTYTGNLPDDVAGGGTYTAGGGATSQVDPGITACPACVSLPPIGCDASSSDLALTCEYFCSTGTPPAATGDANLTIDMSNFVRPNCSNPLDYTYTFLAVDATGTVVCEFDATDADTQDSNAGFATTIVGTPDGIPDAMDPAVQQANLCAGLSPGDYTLVGFHYLTADAPSPIITPFTGQTLTTIGDYLTDPPTNPVGCGALGTPVPFTVLEPIVVTIVNSCPAVPNGTYLSDITITGGYPLEAGAGSYTLTTNFGVTTYTFGTPLTAQIIPAGQTVDVTVDADANGANGTNPPGPLCFDCMAVLVSEAEPVCQLCPDITDGTLGATANAAPATDICSGDVISVCVDVDLTNDATAAVEFTNDAGATWFVGTPDIVAPPVQNIAVDINGAANPYTVTPAAGPYYVGDVVNYQASATHPIEILDPTSAIVVSGVTSNGSFTVTMAGNYTFDCLNPGHPAMFNTITFEARPIPTQYCFDFTETNTASCDFEVISYQAQFNMASLADMTCDLDLQTQDATPADVSVNVYPNPADVVNAVVVNDAACGPSLTQDCANYTVTNDFDANGANPDFGATTTNGAVVFTITNSAAPLACQTTTVNATYNCATCLPPNISTTDAPTICAGESFDLTTVTVTDAEAGNYPANAVITTTYHSATPADGTNVLAATTVTPGTTTTYYILYTNDNETAGDTADDCTGETSVTVTINPAPVLAAITPLGVCADAVLPVTLADYNPLQTAGVAGGTYVWYNDNAGTPDLAGGAITTVSVTGTYWVVYTEPAPSLCEGQTSLALTVNTLPTVDLGADVVQCVGAGDVILDAGAGFTNYNWATGEATQTITITDAAMALTNYSVTVTDANDCTATDDVNVTINALPVFTLENPTVCADATPVTIEGPVGFVAYNWSNGMNTQDISVSAAGAYSLTVTDGNGCMATVLSTVTVNTEPNIGLADITVCADAAPVTIDGPSGFASYSWSNGMNTEDISVTTSGTYTLTALDANGCDAVASSIVTINAIDDASFTIASPICDTDASSSAAIITGNAGGTFAFNPAATDGATINAATGEVTAPAGGFTVAASYTIEYTTSGICSVSSTQVLDIQSCASCPTVAVSPSANETDVCDGDAPTFVAATFNPATTTAAEVTYLWTAPDGSTATTATPNFSLTNAGCAPINVIISYEIECVLTGTLIDAGSFPYTVYPSDITPFYTIEDGGCDGPTITIADGCAANIAITPQAGNPSFPLTATGNGTASYDVVYTPTTACIADAVETANYNCDLDAPSIMIDKDDDDNTDDTQVVNPSGTATFTITVTNNGNVDLQNVVVTDAESPNCDATYTDNGGVLVVGDSWTYTCSINSVTAAFTNNAEVTADPVGGGNPVADNDDSFVTLTNPSIMIDKDDNDNTDDTQEVAAGGTAAFTITVTNTGDVDLENVAVDDLMSPNCVAIYTDNGGVLVVGDSWTYTCTIDDVNAAFTNTADVTADPVGGGGIVTDVDTTEVTIETAGTPSIIIDKTALDGSDLQTINPGEPAVFEITVTNTGNVDLINVEVTDPLSPDCDNVIGSLPVGSFVTYVCQIDDVQAGFINIASVTGTPTDGSPDVDDEDPSEVVTTNPTIEIIKSALDGTDSQTIATGGTAEFEITVTNTGDVNLENVFVTDPLSNDCEQYIGDLAIGGSFTYFCSLVDVENSFTNTAFVTGTPEGGGDEVNDDDPSEVVVEDVPTSPSILVNKTALDGSDLQTVNIGGTATFEITVTNNGDVNLTNVMVTDAMSPSCDMTIGDLAIGESETYTCTFENVTEAFTNIAIATGTPQDGSPDVNDEDPSEVELTNPSIMIDKDDADNTDDTQTVAVNGTATFTITVTNNGDVGLENVMVTDPMSPNCDMTFATLEVGASETYVCTVDDVAASFTNTADVVATPVGGGDDVTDTDDTNVVVEGAPSITIDKDDADNTDDTQTVAVNGTATFTITVTNNGDVDLENVMVTDPQSPNCDMTFATLAIGASETYICTIDGVSTSFTNTADVVATPVGGGDNVTDTDDSEVVIALPSNPSIELTKTAADGSDLQYVAEGGTATFEITVLNNGDVNLTDVTVTDAMSPNCDMMIGDLAVGESYTYTCTINGVTEAFTNIALATGLPEGGGDEIVSDTDDSEVVIALPSNPSIELTKTAADGSDLQYVAEGGTATFEITVLNNGDVNLTDVTVTDAMSPNCDMMIGDLAVGESYTYTCTINGVTEAFTNIALATGLPEGGGDEIVSDSDDTDVELSGNPAILIEKNDADNQNDFQTIYENGTATFTITVTNIGDEPLENIVVTDPLSPNCDAVYMFSPLMPGDLFSYECTIDGVMADFINIATVTADGTETGTSVTDEDDTYVNVVPEPIGCDVALSASATTVCNDNGTYNLTVEISGGNGTYLVNGESTSETTYFAGTYTDEATYTVVIQDAVGDCEAVTLSATPETCIEPVICEQPITVIPNVECNDNGTYNLFAGLFGGSGSYIVNSEETDAGYVLIGTYEDAAPYTITVDDATSVCPSTTVSATPESCTKTCEELIIDADVVCGDDGNYEVVIAIVNGVAPYTVSGTTNATYNEDAFSLGTFLVGTGFDFEITDADGCSGLVTQSIVECGGLTIELLSFEGRANANDNTLLWATATEVDNDYFEVLRSTDGANFESIGKVNGAGNSATINNYQFVDGNVVAQTTFYQLNFVDFNGNVESSDVIELGRNDVESVISIAPNPATDYININFSVTKESELTVKIYDVTGKLIEQQNVNTTMGNNTQNISVSHYNAGLYLLQIEGNEFSQNATFIVD